MRVFMAFLLLLSSVSLALGVTMPLLQVQKLYFLSETPSLIQIITGLFSSGDALLGIIVALFSIVFPTAKLLAAHVAAVAPEQSHVLDRWLGPLAKWSLMDVLLVAIAIFAAKTSGLAVAGSQAGLWFYTIATLSMAGAFSIARRTAPPAETERPQAMAHAKAARDTSGVSRAAD
ncbi:MAG TPA: paraquat-inducible protein A [Rhizobiaceae bacterium]|nr:paraquat-inducible protein A [Rhizobiaceae bacterium]